MIEALDHIVIQTTNAGSAAAGYEAVLGRTATGARLQLDNMALEFSSPAAAPAAVPSAGLALMFGVADLAASAHRLERRAIPCAPPHDGRVILDIAATHNVAIGLVAQSKTTAAASAAHDILGLDHVVVRTRDPERAVALYGGRLGLDLRLDRTNPERGNRLLFFVCGDLVVEISHDTGKGVRPGPDSIWGLAWRSADIHLSRARMQAAGIAVSEIRPGNRPGTEVFTVKSHTFNVPTLVIGGHGLTRR
jgi:catechol 2,3-dioxygenase-like lactoylglutathione lyase family enzyme